VPDESLEESGRGKEGKGSASSKVASAARKRAHYLDIIEGKGAEEKRKKSDCENLSSLSTTPQPARSSSRFSRKKRGRKKKKDLRVPYPY